MKEELEKHKKAFLEFAIEHLQNAIDNDVPFWIFDKQLGCKVGKGLCFILYKYENKYLNRLGHEWLTMQLRQWFHNLRPSIRVSPFWFPTYASVAYPSRLKFVKEQLELFNKS